MTKYSKGFIGLHWLIAVVVISMLSVSFFLEDLPKVIRPTAIMLHKSFGLSILLLTLMRLIWVIIAKRPALPITMPRWEVYLARGVQGAFYVFLISMAMAGWLMSVLSNRIPIWFGLFPLSLPGVPHNSIWAEWFFQGHQTIAWILITLICLHIAGALKHAIIDKDKVMESMLP